ncbi:hypothetical protein SNE40_015271 [Patella caerulea]|uniref:CUB domain-containing protein n=2 Tax=Patella caerulea TaxID=87958 RepID=A0AAN8JN35_PATCE
MKNLCDRIFFFVSFLSYHWCYSISASEPQFQKYGMDDSNVCLKDTKTLFWINDGTSVIVIGKDTPPLSANAAAVCKLIFGSKSEKGMNTLHVNFESFYINDCAISLHLHQSPSSVFDADVEKILSLSCEMPKPAAFYTKEGNLLMLSLDREDQYMREYNFRINITLSVGPPKTGPSTAVLIIVAVALLSAIVIIAFVIMKYLKLKREVWRERRAERAIVQAIHVYNSQELHHRDTHYTSVPSSRHCPTHERLQYGSNQHNGSHNGSLIHGDSGNLYNIDYSDSDIQQPLCELDENILNESNRQESDSQSLPPSYEEALDMPKPSLPESPIYANT